MHTFLLTLGYGLAALFGVAVLVAWWEHWSSAHRAREPLPDLPPPVPAPVRVDVDLAMLEAPLQGILPLPERSATASLSRAARQLGAAGSPLAWTETRPMVGPGSAVEPQPRAVAESGST